MLRGLRAAASIAAFLSISTAIVSAQSSAPPTLEISSWTNAGEKDFKLDQAKGKVVLIAFLTGFC